MKKQKKMIFLKKNSFVNNNLFKGNIDAGTVYGVTLLALAVGAGYMMLGNIDPSTASPDNGQPVIIQSATDTSNHSDLQLKDFAAVTLTPSPSPTPTPTPTPTIPPAPAPGGSGGGGGGPLPLPLPGGSGGGSGGGGGGGGGDGFNINQTSTLS